MHWGKNKGWKRKFKIKKWKEEKIELAKYHEDGQKS